MIHTLHCGAMLCNASRKMTIVSWVFTFCILFSLAVRFGRVPKREKAKILAEMQKANQQSQIIALQAELEDDSKLISSIVQAHMETCEYTRAKVTALFEEARHNPNYAKCPTQMVNILYVLKYMIFIVQ